MAIVQRQTAYLIYWDLMENGLTLLPDITYWVKGIGHLIQY